MISLPWAQNPPGSIWTFNHFPFLILNMDSLSFTYTEKNCEQLVPFHFPWETVNIYQILPLNISVNQSKGISKSHFFMKDYKWHRNTEKTDIKRLFTVNLNSFPDRHYLLQSAQLGEALSSKEFSSYLLYPSVETTGQGCGTNTQAQGSPCAKHLWIWQQASETQKADKGDKQKTLMVIFRLGKFLTWHYW